MFSCGALSSLEGLVRYLGIHTSPEDPAFCPDHRAQLCYVGHVVSVVLKNSVLPSNRQPGQVWNTYVRTYIHTYIHSSCVVVHTYVHAWVLVRMLHMRLSIQESPGVYWKKDCLNTCDWHSTATAGQPRAASQLPTDCPSPHTVCTACHSVSVTYVLPLTGPLQWNVM